MGASRRPWWGCGALLVGAVITSLTLKASLGGGARRPPPTGRARTAPARSQTPGRALPPSVRQPVVAAELHVAAEVAGWFLRSYLQFAYGRAGAGSVTAVTPGLRGQLIGKRGQVALAERRRHARVLSLRVVGTTPGFVVATAAVSDGGIAAFRLRFTLQDRAGRWLVSSVRQG
jgi:hypothetical protein